MSRRDHAQQAETSRIADLMTVTVSSAGDRFAGLRRDRRFVHVERPRCAQIQALEMTGGPDPMLNTVQLTTGCSLSRAQAMRALLARPKQQHLLKNPFGYRCHSATGVPFPRG